MPEQRRKHLRLPIESTSFIELLLPRLGQAESGRMITCKTMNVSRGGLQVILAEEITVGAILQIGVDLPGADGTLYLAGEVRWCLPSNDQQNPWMAGFQILNADDSDIERWVALIAAMES
jgi:Tfp pilus assembly protein PilZ